MVGWVNVSSAGIFQCSHFLPAGRREHFLPSKPVLLYHISESFFLLLSRILGGWGVRGGKGRVCFLCLYPSRLTSDSGTFYWFQQFLILNLERMLGLRHFIFLFPQTGDARAAAKSRGRQEGKQNPNRKASAQECQGPGGLLAPCPLGWSNPH